MVLHVKKKKKKEKKYKVAKAVNLQFLYLMIHFLTKQSKIVYHDKSSSFETDFGWLIRFNGKKETFETKYPFLLMKKLRKWSDLIFTNESISAIKDKNNFVISI